MGNEGIGEVRLERMDNTETKSLILEVTLIVTQLDIS